MDYDERNIFSPENFRMDTSNTIWCYIEGQAEKRRDSYKNDKFGAQKGLSTCRRSRSKLDWKTTRWIEREGQVENKTYRTKKDKVGAQKGLSKKFITYMSRRLYPHLNVQKSCSKQDMDRNELPTPDITEKGRKNLAETGYESSCNEFARQTFLKIPNLANLISTIFVNFVFCLLKPSVNFSEILSNSLKYIDPARTRFARYTAKNLQLQCKITCHDVGTDVDQTRSNTETEYTVHTDFGDETEDLEHVKLDRNEVDVDAACNEELIKSYFNENEDTEVSIVTTTENDISDMGNSATESEDGLEIVCVLSTASDNELEQNFDWLPYLFEVCSCGIDAFEIQLESAHKLSGSKFRINVVSVPPTSNLDHLNRVGYRLDSSQDLKEKDVADENDPVKILSRTQMLIPRESEVTIFTVIGIIDRLAMGQQVPARESMKYEMLRFCTFRQYPTSGKPSTIKLAKAGFYYATNRDEVICYCCAKRISNWKENDDPMLAHKHVTPNCDFLLKNAEVNIPISITDESDVIQRLQRLENDPEFNNQVFHETSPEALERINNLLTDYVRSDGRPENDRSNIAVTSDPLEANRDSAVARDGILAGSFVSSLPPTVAENRKEAERPFTSLVGRDVNNAAGGSTFQKLENMTGIMVSDFGRMPVFINTKAEQPSDDYSGNTVSSRGSSSNTTASNSTNITTNITTSSQSQRPSQTPATVTSVQLPRSTQIPAAVTAAKGIAVNSPSALPKYPRYSTRSARVASFSECRQIAVQIDWLCDAGFFYAGSGDSTRCFFCGIGLRHWSADDDPWTEHARFSIKCQFVLEQKGQEFINIVKLAVEVSEKAAKNAAIVSNTDVMKSEAAVSALAMGYSAEQVRKAIDAINARKQSSTATNGGHQLNGHDILEEIFRMEEQTNNASAITETPETEPDNLTEEGACAGIVSRQSQSDILPLGSDRLPQQQRAASDSVVARSDVERKKKRLLQENKMLRSASLCTKCNRREICMVFLPCGHLVTCEECGKATRICTSCASRVKGTVRTYMA